MKIGSYRLRHLVLAFSIFGMMGFAVYSNYTISRLQRNAFLATSTYASLISSSLKKSSGYNAYNILYMEQLISNFDIPLIITDTLYHPITWTNIEKRKLFRSYEIFPDNRSSENMEYMYKKIYQLKNKHTPRVIFARESADKMAYLLYDDNKLLRGLRWMPLFDAGFVIVFSIMVYLAIFSTMNDEKSSLWVGLAKETAHQLGTPISSLMGWVEYMRLVNDPEEDIPPEKVISQIGDICNDMDKDLVRLNKVTTRFGQIGSIPTYAKTDMKEIIDSTVKYFRTRLPLLGKKIEINLALNSAPQVYLNRDLIEWVLENLLKNSVDAMDKKEGYIKLYLDYIAVENIIRIRHRDCGKGIAWDDHQSIFSPGFTTKKRGWGLGLALAKRIVEEYHEGSIYVSWSQKGEGTEFTIDLPVERKKSKKDI